MSQLHNWFRWYPRVSGMLTEKERSSAEAHFKNCERRGVPEYEYYTRWIAQGRVCACCGAAEPSSKNGFFYVDHCHQTNDVRGLLCHPCNAAIGMLGDNYEATLRAAMYLATGRGGSMRGRRMSDQQIGDAIEQALRLHTPWSGMSVSRLVGLVEAGRPRIVAVLQHDRRFDDRLVDVKRPHLGRRWQLAKW